MQRKDIDLQRAVCLVQRKDLPMAFGVQVPGFSVTPLPIGYTGLTILQQAQGIVIATHPGLPPLRVLFGEGRCDPLPVNEALRKFHLQ